MNRRALPSALLWPLAIVVGCGLFVLTGLVEPAAERTLNFGTEYAQMATDPFGLVGKFPHRILSPLLANVLGLGGDGFVRFAYGTLVGLMAMWFVAAHRLGASPVQALVLTAVLSFTGAVQLFKGHLGYPDPMTFLLLTATIVVRHPPAAFWTLQLLNVMHHEQVLFFWPWLLFWRHRLAGARWRHDLIGGGSVLAAYLGWRLFVGAHATGQMLTMEHYSALDYFPVGTMGLAALNLLSTFIWFGALPIVVAWHGFADGWRRAGIGIVLLLACQHAVFGVAHDVYRFTCFLFVPLLFAGLRLMQQPRGTWLLAAVGGVTVWLIELQKPVFVEVGQAVLVEMTPAGPAVRKDIVGDIVPKVIPAYWHVFAGYGALLVATLVLGWLWSRRMPPVQEPEVAA